MGANISMAEIILFSLVLDKALVGMVVVMAHTILITTTNLSETNEVSCTNNSCHVNNNIFIIMLNFRIIK